MPFGIVCRVCFAEFPSSEALGEHRQVHVEPESSAESISEHAIRFRAHLRQRTLEQFNTYVPDPSPWNLMPMTTVDAVESEETQEYERRKREMRATIRERYAAYVPDPTPYAEQPMARVPAVESEEAREYERAKRELRSVRRLPYVRPHWQSPQELARDDFLLKTCVFSEKRTLHQSAYAFSDSAYDAEYAGVTDGYRRAGTVEQIQCMNSRCGCNDVLSRFGSYCQNVWGPESADSIAENLH